MILIIKPKVLRNFSSGSLKKASEFFQYVLDIMRSLAREYIVKVFTNMFFIFIPMSS